VDSCMFISHPDEAEVWVPSQKLGYRLPATSC